MEPDPLPAWWQPGAMALLLVDLQQGTCGDAPPQGRPAFDAQFRAHTLPAAQRALAAARQAHLEVIHTVIANLTSEAATAASITNAAAWASHPAAAPPR